MKALMCAAVLLPILSGAALPLFRFKKRLHREIYVETAVLLTSAVVLALLLRRPEGTLRIFRLTSTLEIALPVCSPDLWLSSGPSPRSTLSSTSSMRAATTGSSPATP